MNPGQKTRTPRHEGPRAVNDAPAPGTRGRPSTREVIVDGPDDGDEVARQRRKRATSLLDRPVAGFDDVTLNDVIRSVLAAIEESAGRLDWERLLTERGHAWQTVEMVGACLTFVDMHESSPPPRSGR